MNELHLFDGELSVVLEDGNIAVQQHHSTMVLP